MTCRYLIVKHLSLGPGVLLKRESNDQGVIYFSGIKSIKSVVLSHPYLSVAQNLNLNQFVTLGLYEGIFNSDVKNSAKEYFDNHITNMHLGESECYGEISDNNHAYSFRITIDNNGFINLSCTCQDVCCKHLYAVFVNVAKLLNPRASNVNISSDGENEFKGILEKFLYVRGTDNIQLICKLTYQIRTFEKAKLFLETILPFYLRGQYKARVINDILAPLMFSENNVTNFKKIISEKNNDIDNMLNEANFYFHNILLPELERKNNETKKANLYSILLSPDCSRLVTLLKHAEDNYSEERLACQVMAEYIKYNDLTIEDIAALKSCYLFQINHRYYMNDLLTSPAKNRISTYLLFFDELPFDENKIKQIPLEFILRVAPFSNDKSHYVQIAHLYFDQIKEEHFSLLAELLVGVSLQHDFIDERTIRLAIELAKKLPKSTYILELVAANIRRPKKSQVR